jgi:hypothetical protein
MVSLEIIDLSLEENRPQVFAEEFDHVEVVDKAGMVPRESGGPAKTSHHLGQQWLWLAYRRLCGTSDLIRLPWWKTQPLTLKGQSDHEIEVIVPSSKLHRQQPRPNQSPKPLPFKNTYLSLNPCPTRYPSASSRK